MKKMFKGIIGFFKGVGSEVKKTSWPSKGFVAKSTVTVIIVVFVMMVFFVIVDLGISNALRMLIG